jgi:cystathionine beta-lyase
VNREAFDAIDVERLRRRRTVKWTLYGPDVLAAWVAEMDFDVAPAVRRALVDAVDREDFGYVPGDLSPLTTASADFFAARYGWSVPPARVFPVSDVLVGIGAALDVFTATGSAVVVPTPAYPPFFEVVELTGRPVVAVPLVVDARRDTLDLDAIDAALAGGAASVLLCNPHNPTGRVFNAAELTALATVVDRHGARVVADEVHAPLVFPGAAFVPYATVSDASADHAVTITSASKAFNLAGLKCAQVVTSNHADAKRWRKLGVFEVPGSTPLGIAASVAAYRDGGAWLADLVAYLDANRRRLLELLAAELPGVECRCPEATFLAWLDCAALGLDDPWRFFLDHAHVALSDGPPFGAGAGYEQYVRLNFATSAALLERIVGALGEAVRARSEETPGALVTRRSGTRSSPIRPCRHRRRGWSPAGRAGREWRPARRWRRRATSSRRPG